ncbi:helix-turn-helix domain-containing protein [Oscillospiraceae bacterium 44-5]
MNFKELMLQARDGSMEAEEKILMLYKPLLLKESIQDGTFDEDLYQELCITLIKCIRIFRF